MSKKYAGEMLELWRANERWLNYGASYQNLPYMLLFGGQAQTLFGRRIRKNSSIYKSLKDRKELNLVECGKGFVQVRAATKEFVEIYFGVYGRKCTRIGEHLTETFRLDVRINNTVVHNEVIEVDPLYLDALVNLSPERSHRDIELLEIAQGALG